MIQENLILFVTRLLCILRHHNLNEIDSEAFVGILYSSGILEKKDKQGNQGRGR